MTTLETGASWVEFLHEKMSHLEGKMHKLTAVMRGVDNWNFQVNLLKRWSSQTDGPVFYHIWDFRFESVWMN